MKKFIISLLIFTIGLTAYAQDSIVSKAKDSAEVTWGKVYNDTKSALTQFGAALKVGGEHIYEVLVKQQIIHAIINTLLLIIVVFVLIKSIRAILTVEDWDEPTPKAVLGIIFGLISTICLVVSLCNINIIITGFFNPEYGVIKEIMDKLK